MSFEAVPGAVPGLRAPRLPPRGLLGPVTDPGPVVALVAWCDEATDAVASPGSRSFDVLELAELADGRQVLLDERGWSESGPRPAGGVTALPTREDLEQSVRNVVLPDEDPADGEVGEDHPYEWLATRAREQGLDVTADQLRAVSYRIELAPELAARLW